MIVSLTIKDIVLIDRLQMDFEVGLCVLSGETGAGKSILLSSIGLAIGARGGRELIRHGKEQGSVSAEFSLAKKHKIWKILDFGQKISRLRCENPHFWRFQTPKKFRAPSARDFFYIFQDFFQDLVYLI